MRFVGSETKGIWLLSSLALVVFVVALLAGVSRHGHSQAGTILGTIDQSTSASDAGIVVEARRADFSGNAVFVELLVTVEDSDIVPAGIRPRDAVLEGVPGLSGHVRADGTTVIQFPPSAWPIDATTLELTVSSVDFIDDAGELQPTTGSWELAIEAPDGGEADVARSIEALDPVVVRIAGQDVVIMTVRSHDATVVRYELPPGVESAFGPKLKAGGALVERRQGGQSQRPGITEAWYAPTSSQPLVLLFDDLTAVDPDPETWGLDIGLEAFAPPGADGNEGSSLSEVVVDWELLSRSGGPEVLDVLWRRSPDRVELVVVVDSSWRAGPTSPTVLADGVPLGVIGAGTIGTGVDARSDFVVELDPLEPLPRQITVHASSEVYRLPPVEVDIKP
ncbi:MAG: hypothetical protein R3C29_02380 [Dehalococcoidia bacterium]